MISVVIPFYNEEDNLGPCLTSLAQQDYRGEFELVLVNNNSTDRSLDRVHEFRRAHPEVCLRLFNETQQGIAPAAQRGFQESRHPIVARTDADTVVDRQWLRVIMESFRDPRVMAISGPPIYRASTRQQRLLSWEWAIPGWQRTHFFIKRPILWGFNFAVRCTAFSQIGGFNTALRYGEDWDLSVRIQRACGDGQHVKYVAGMRVYPSARRFVFSRGYVGYMLVSGLWFYVNRVWWGRVPPEAYRTTSEPDPQEVGRPRAGD